LSLREVGKRYDGGVVLDEVTLEVSTGEFVAFIGPSGCGKSTLLRLIAGLVEPSAGEVRWEGRRLRGVNADVGLVFQSFALLPWLRVIDNVALPLEARGASAGERYRRAEHYLHLVGLGGHARAFPKELSGGMKQRTGLARALCQEPTLLLMDEPFSALDVLTAHALRALVLDLWQSPQVPTKTVLIVTHSIEEAVTLADRVVVFHAEPGRVVADERLDLPRPRRSEATDVRAAVDRLYSLLV